MEYTSGAEIFVSSVKNIVYAHAIRENKVKFWFDTEFIEDGKTIELLSIGIVSEDERIYYAEPMDTDRGYASSWVQENVIPHLTGPIKPRSQIAKEIIEFVGVDPEFWAYYADYDWVVLCQLYGTMMDLPNSWPKMCLDVKQFAIQTGQKINKTILFNAKEHNALSDALWTKNVFYYLGSGLGE